ncbi:hypothetical protein DM02DRAFT_270747 [Periconia macrospinosa]|uniref:Uncharacterized protein n=1 Tax=Periconia macrospinosa TaxID=97972 RepID=A0A2V1D513_9PLEO|nr:hypothetical protein DM02DRAFT_270747 [Periconia macrospinosa]
MAEHQRRGQHYPYTTNKRARQACENCRSVRIQEWVSSILWGTNTSAAARNQNAQERDLIVLAVRDYNKDAFMPLISEPAKDPRDLEMTRALFLKQLAPMMYRVLQDQLPPRGGGKFRARLHLAWGTPASLLLDPYTSTPERAPPTDFDQNMPK